MNDEKFKKKLERLNALEKITDEERERRFKNRNTAYFYKHFYNENLSFGRFPVLSLCILYKANKIIKAHKQILFNRVFKYKIIDEPFEVYKKFRDVAGRSLRLYVNEKTNMSQVFVLFKFFKFT